VHAVASNDEAVSNTLHCNNIMSVMVNIISYSRHFENYVVMYALTSQSAAPLAKLGVWASIIVGRTRPGFASSDVCICSYSTRKDRANEGANMQEIKQLTWSKTHSLGSRLDL
jgi:hypothetical protein